MNKERGGVMSMFERSKRPGRLGIALPLVLVLTMLVIIGVGGVYFMMRTGLQRAGRIKTDTEHMYLGEAVLANIVNNLKKLPWELRFYRGSGPAPYSKVMNGAYRGADYVAVVEDVVDLGSNAVIPDLTDILLQINYRGLTRNFFARVTVTIPTVLRPTNVNIVKFSPVEPDITDPVARDKLKKAASQEMAEQTDALPETNTVVREVEALVESGLTDANDIQEQVTQAPLASSIATEGEYLAKLAEAQNAIDSGLPGKYALALAAYEAALAIAEGQDAKHKDANVPRTLMSLAQANIGIFEEAMAGMTDPLADPITIPGMTDALERALTLYQQLLDNYPNSADVPYALFNKAKVFVKLGETGKAEKTFEDLEKAFPDLHLWGEDQTIAGNGAKDGVVSFELALLNKDASYFLSADERPDGVAQIYFIDKDKVKIRITDDPRPKDQLSVSPDGTRIAYRALMPDGTFRLVVVDYDGNRSMDLTVEEGEWTPEWKLVMDKLDFNPILYESAPDTLYTTQAIDVSDYPPVETTDDTLRDLIDYAQTLAAQLATDPYSTFPAKLVVPLVRILQAEKAAAASEATPAPKKSDAENKKGIDKIMSAIVTLEEIKDDFNADYWWQTPDAGDDDDDDQ